MSSENETLDGIENADGKPGDAESPETKVEAPAAGGAEAGVAGEAATAENDETAGVDPQAALRAELEETKLNWARERADFSNYRKRMIEEVGRARQSGIGNFVKGLVPVVDNLDLVLAAPADDPAVKNFVIGVEMIRTEFLSVLARENIKPAVSVDDPFDPHMMEAVELEEREGLEGDRVLHVYKKAYVFQPESGDRQVLRPAAVRVGRAKKTPPPAGEVSSGEQG